MEKEIELQQEAVKIYSSGGAVDSVNGYTGTVVLTTSDLENTSDYQTGTEVESAISTAISGKQDTLTAGNNITISNNTISATDTTYSAGTGLTLSGTQFSVNTGTIATQQDVTDEATARQNADINLQGQIDAISSASDVTDIVGTYAALQAYDTQHLKDNDIIKVLQDESQNDETTYYRWSTTTHTFTLIGEEGPYYTKSATDVLLQGKQDVLTAGSNITIASDNTISATDTTYTAGTNVSISSGNVISATDTTYLDFTGTDGTSAGAAGLVPAPATTDAGKFLKADGTWDTAGGGASYTAGDGINITNNTISTTNTGKAKILTTADYNYPTTGTKDGIALWLLDEGTYIVSDNASLKVYYGAGFGTNSSVSSELYSVAPAKTSSGKKQVWAILTSFSQPHFFNYVNLSSGNGSYIWLPSVTDNLTSTSASEALSAKQGKVLKDLVDGLAISGAGAPTTSTVGTVGKLYEDTTNGKLYICTDATNPYVWEEVGAGGSGPTVVQTPGTSTSDVMSQNATTSMVFADPNTKYKVKLGNQAQTSGDFTIAIGRNAQVQGGNRSVAIGCYTTVGPTHYFSVALGANSETSSNGEVSIGGSSMAGTGYNNSNYRLLTNVYDGQNDHDAATVGQIKMGVLSATPTGTTVGFPGRLYTYDSGGGTYEVYLCVHDNGDNTYVWKQITA